jgi:hypothetical protein
MINHKSRHTVEGGGPRGSDRKSASTPQRNRNKISLQVLKARQKFTVRFYLKAHKNNTKYAACISVFFPLASNTFRCELRVAPGSICSTNPAEKGPPDEQHVAIRAR